MNKYLVLFPIPNPFSAKLIDLMDEVASITGVNPPHYKLPPHMTFHRPLTGIDEGVLKNLVASAALQMKQARIMINSLYSFGRHYVVLPVQATREVASLWVGINDLLTLLPEYKDGKYDGDNTLHITIAAKTLAVFDRSWPKIQEIRFEPMTIPLTAIALCRKPIEKNRWELVDKFYIPA